MVDRLTAIFSRIDNCAIPLREPLRARDLCGGPLQVAEQFLVFLLRVSNGRDVLPRDDKDMYRRLRLDICKGVAMLILVDGFRGNASIDDLAEDATHDEEFTGAFSNRRGIRGSDVWLQRVCG